MSGSGATSRRDAADGDLARPIASVQHLIVVGQDTEGGIRIDGSVGDDKIEILGDDGGMDVTVYGGAGNDGIFGGRGNDALFGDDGNDTIVGFQGDDLLVGDAGNDYLQ